MSDLMAFRLILSNSDPVNNSVFLSCMFDPDLSQHQALEPLLLKIISEDNLTHSGTIF